MAITKILGPYYFGVASEFLAIIYLKLKFYKILARRYKTKLGEIDIIAVKKNQIIFVEVKARQQKTDITGIIPIKQQDRVKMASSLFLNRNPKYLKYAIRYDAIILTSLRLIHFKNMW